MTTNILTIHILFQWDLNEKTQMPKALPGEAMFKSRVVRFRQLCAAVMQPAACSHALMRSCVCVMNGSVTVSQTDHM